MFRTNKENPAKSNQNPPKYKNVIREYMTSQIVYFIQLYICRTKYIDKIVKIAYLSGDLTVGILNLNDDMIEYWN